MKKIRIIGTLLLLAVVLLSNTKSAEEERATTIFAEGVVAKYRFFSKKGKSNGDEYHTFSEYENVNGVRKVLCKLKSENVYTLNTEYYMVNDGDNLYNSPEKIIPRNPLPEFDPDFNGYHVMPMTDDMKGKKLDDINLSIQYVSTDPRDVSSSSRDIYYSNRSYQGIDTISILGRDIECHVMSYDYGGRGMVKRSFFVKMYYHGELGIVRTEWYKKNLAMPESWMELISLKTK